MPTIEDTQLISVENSDLVGAQFIIPDVVSHVSLTAFSRCDQVTKVVLNSLIDQNEVRDWLFHKNASVQVIRHDGSRMRVIRFNIPEGNTTALTASDCVPIDSNTYISVQVNESTMYDEPVPEGDDPHAMLNTAIKSKHCQRAIGYNVKEFVDYILSLSAQINQILTFLGQGIALVDASYPHYHLMQYLNNTYRKIKICLLELSESEDRNLNGIISIVPNFHNYEIMFNYLMSFISHNRYFLSLHEHYCQLSTKFIQISECIEKLSDYPDLFELYKRLILKNQLSLQAASMVTMRVSLLIKELESCFTKLNRLQSLNESIQRDISFLSG